MSAPFALPDTISVFTPTGDPFMVDVPARVVPIFDPKQWFVSNAGAPMNRYGPTHWVDLDTAYGHIPDTFELVEAFRIRETGDPFTITLSTDNGILTLAVGYTEYRYTTTENVYMRVYCTRKSFEVF